MPTLGKSTLHLPAFQFNAAAQAVKVHNTAVAVVPPAYLWRPIQAIRCFRDKSFVRWPPHGNLLYPFLPDVPEGGLTDPGVTVSSADPMILEPGPEAAESFKELAVRASKALAAMAPFRVRLERLRTFRHSARSFTVWADPVTVPDGEDDGSDAGGGGGGSGCGGGSGGGLQQVQRLLEAEFPDCRDLSRDEGRGIDGFVPHLSLGQLRDEAELQALQAAWTPIEFEVDSVQLISRRGYLSPFTIRYHVPLGQGLAAGPYRLHAGNAGLRNATSLAGGGGDDDGDVSGGRTDGNRVLRLDVPYVATISNLVADGGGRSANDEAATAGRRGGLVGRFASPTLAASPSAFPSLCPGGVAPGAATRDRPSPSGKTLSGSKRSTCSISDGRVPAAVVQGASREGKAAPRLDAGLDELPACGVEATSAGSAAADSGSGEDGPHVWWFAYGAAPSAGPAGLGAVEGFPARLEGYRLAFNRRGGRANLVPAPHPSEQGEQQQEKQQQAPTSAQPQPHPPAGPHGWPEAPVVAPLREGPEGPTRCRRGGASGVAPSAATPEAGSSGCGLSVSGGGIVLGGSGGGGDDWDEGGWSAGGSELTAAPASVHGVLFRVPVERMARLLMATSEACPVEVRCRPYDDKATAVTGAAASSTGPTGSQALAEHASVVTAVAFLVPPEGCLAEEVAPAEGYIAAVAEACEPYGLDAGFRSWLRSLPKALPEGAERSRAYDAGADGQSLARRGAFRTGAKKAAAVLPRAALDW